jgi:hypothetical protein
VPRLEPLEDRTVPTSTATQSGPLLIINGSPGADTVHLFDRGAGLIDVQLDQDPILHSFTGINTINVNTFAGRDTVTYDLVPTFGVAFLFGLGVSENLAVNVDLGDGANVFRASFHQNDLGADSQLALNVKGGKGSDVLGVDATGGVDVGNQARLAISLNAGGGNDLIATGYEGIVTGNLTLTANAGDGRDRVIQRYVVPNNSTGTLVARARGGPGSDGLRMEVAQPLVLVGVQPLAPPLRLDALIDGGPGRDRAVFTPNVGVINSEIQQIIAPTVTTVTPTQL